jgi:peptidoglycan/LPS O-acetylase OafA/YrhL
LSTAKAKQGRFDPRSYAIDRFSRLFIAFVPAVLLTLLLDHAGAAWFGATGIYDASNPLIIEKVLGKPFEDHLGLPLVLGNLAMLQNYFVPMLGSNEPLWTLSTEFWFYVVFGLLLTAWLAKGPKRFALLLAGLGITAALALAKGPGEFVGWCGVWAIGFAAACIRPGRTGPWWVPLAALLAWLAFMRINTETISPSMMLIFAADYVLAVLFSWLILSMRNTRLPLLERLGRFNKAMADFSYSLYLVHHPLLMFMVAVLGTSTGLAGFAAGFQPNDPVGLGLYPVLLVAIFALCWLFAQATERHTGKLRRWMKRKLLG